MNEGIDCPEVRLVDSSGESLGVKCLADALMAARAAGLDLILVDPLASPPVAKISDFGRYRYNVKRHQSVSHAGTKRLKELRLSISISAHDLQIKLNRAAAFISDGHQVRFTIKMHGRELMHKEKALELANNVIIFMDQYGKVQDPIPTLLGNTVTILFNPDKAKKKFSKAK